MSAADFLVHYRATMHAPRQMRDAPRYACAVQHWAPPRRRWPSAKTLDRAASVAIGAAFGLLIALGM